MRTLWKGQAVVVLALLLAIACAPVAPMAGPSSAAQPAPTSASTSSTAVPKAAATVAQTKIKRGGVLVQAASAHAPTLDPIYDSGGPNLKELGLYEALLRYDVTDFKEGKLEIRPELAESWERNSPTSVTFKLRKGVKFHDGTEFNACVAKWSLERMGSAPKSLSKAYASNFASLEVVDPYTLRINYKQPSALQLLNLTPATVGTGFVGTMILSKAQMDAVGEEAFGTSKASGTGPFKMQEWKRDNEFVLTKFDGYWRNGEDGQKLPYLDGVRYRLIPDTAVHITELKAGSLHLSRSLTPADLQVVRANPELQDIVISWAPRRWTFGFNQEKEPFGKNLKLRQAAQYATDRESIAKVLGAGVGAPNNYVAWIPDWPGWDTALPRYDFDLDKAATLMKEAGYPSGVDIHLLHYSPPHDRRMGEMLQQMWGKIGIRMTLTAADSIAARAKVKAGEFEMHQWGMGHSPDPAHFNRMFLCDGSANWNNYCNKEVEKCMIDGEAELDSAKRVEIYKRCQKMVYEDAQLGGLYLGVDILVFRKEVKGLKIQTHSQDVQEIWIDK